MCPSWQSWFENNPNLWSKRTSSEDIACQPQFCRNFMQGCRIFLALMFYSRCTIKSQPNVGQYVIHESFRKEKCFQFDFQVREFLFRLQSGDSDMFMSGVMRVALPWTMPCLGWEYHDPCNMFIHHQVNYWMTAFKRQIRPIQVDVAKPDKMSVFLAVYSLWTEPDLQIGPHFGKI